MAREASSLVPLDDDFGSIVGTIRLGRRIYDNLRKAMAYIIAVHMPIAGLALLPLLTGTTFFFCGGSKAGWAGCCVWSMGTATVSTY